MAIRPAVKAIRRSPGKMPLRARAHVEKGSRIPHLRGIRLALPAMIA